MSVRLSVDPISSSDNLVGAIEAAESSPVKPLLGTLIRLVYMVVDAGPDEELLQRVTALLKEKGPDVAVDHVVVMAYVRSGQVEKARALMKADNFVVQFNRFMDFCRSVSEVSHAVLLWH